MSYSRLFSLSLIVLLASPQVMAEPMYVCRSPSGVPTYQQTECTGPFQHIEVAPIATVDAGLRPSEQKRLAAISKSKPKSKRQQAQSESDVDVAAQQCLTKRQRLAQVEAHLRAGYKASMGDGLRRKRDQYEEYLNTFCH